jgi:hypothetical protein
MFPKLCGQGIGPLTLERPPVARQTMYMVGKSHEK